MSETPCRVKDCPSLAKPGEPFAYCAIHHKVATDIAVFDQALKGKAGASLRRFAEDLDRFIYPRSF